VKLVLPRQQAHVDAVRERALGLAADDDPAKPA
jgi:hypothetical protein